MSLASHSCSVGAAPAFFGNTASRRRSRWYGTLPKHIVWMFFLAALYVVLPFVEVPLLGLSLSAPVFFLIVGEVFLRGGRIDQSALKAWSFPVKALGAALVFTFLASLFVNQGLNITLKDAVLLIRYLYWLVVFLATATVVANLADPGRLVRILGWAVIVLAAVRLVEMARLGVMANPELLTKNSYGFIFSCFCPFAFALALGKGRSRSLRRAGFGVLILAMLLNLSRGNWVASAFALLAMTGVMAGAGRVRAQAVKGVVAAVLAGIALSVVAPSVIWEPIGDRLESFKKTDQERSVLIRKVMVQKSWKLFVASPFVGVGPGRFTSAMADLELPSRLRYYSQEGINRRSSHNSWAQWLAETGLVGTAALVYLVGLLVLQGYRAGRALAGHGALWGLAMWAGMIGMCVHLWVVAGITGTLTWMMFGMVAGIITWWKRWRRPGMFEAPSGFGRVTRPGT